MLFNLTDSLLGYTSSQRHKVIVGVTNLLIGYFEGKNLLMISDGFYDHFSKVISDERALLSLRHLHSYTTYVYNVNKRFNVVLDSACGSDEILIDYFYNTSSIQPVKIIGENANDVEFYAIVTQIIKHVDKKHIAYSLVHGGGYTTAGRLEQCQNNNELSLCIVDSDIKFPGARKGATCGQIETVYDSKNKFVLLIVIKVHEIENLIPPKFIVDRAKKESKRIAQRFLENGNEKYLRWYDLKNGISIVDIEDPLYKAFAITLYNHFYDSKPEAFDRHVSQCKQKKEKVFPELTNNLVKKYLGLPIEKQNVYPILFKDEWREIADNFYDFACSREKDPIYI